MKIKVTNPYINAMFRNVYRAGYGDLQDILPDYMDAKFYNCGVYGWNYDCYIDYKYDLAITTGYRNMTGKRISENIFNKYNDIAKQIRKEYDWKDYEKKQELLENNWNEFCKELVNQR